MKIMCVALVGAAILTASGCASVIDGDTQSLTVTTIPADGANCTLSNKRGSWTVVTPASVIVKRSQSTLKAVCTKDGFSDSTAYLASTQSSSAILGALTLGIPEAIADASTGAGNDYAKQFLIHLKPAVPQSVAVSAQAKSSQSPAGMSPAGSHN